MLTLPNDCKIMNPEEKAHEIFNRYNKNCLQILVGMVNREKRKLIIKSCAITCVQEIILANPHGNPLNSNAETTMEYWSEVEKEIRKI